ncbi:hypothetical protein E3T26_08610 [Cryobacterium sp. TMT1-21]|uniref:hypothetical protein n=1 Tax=Cryobacterium sp. TMT1-21 TaxID=1259234 RepID=UPI00106ACAD3|nr:hypothetical protein [Cryobacterium sp. TMT1-21]TFD14175.1 hypothetical protein E3T26_08610 [Cryobacterium sp. TMT1-21]
MPENKLTRAVIDARQVARERKGSAQRVSGSNLAFITSESSSTFDWSGRLDTLAFSGLGYAGLSITLTSQTAVVPMTDIAITLYTSTNGVNWTEYSYGKGIADSYNGVSPQMTRAISVLQGAEVAEYTSLYSLVLYGDYNARAAFKVQAVGSDSLAISIARTA